MKHNVIIQREFSKQAPKFGEKGLTLSSQDILAWIMALLPLDKRFQILDVAAGTGHLSLAVAPYVKDVFAIDITREMIVLAREEARKKSLDNVSFQEGSAENLPYEADCFDLIVSRLAIHHFETPMIHLREMVRVCKPGHRIGIIDLLSPEDAGIAKAYNDLERLRDSSHTAALSKIQMQTVLTEVGLTIEKIESKDVKVDFQRWVQMTGTKPETAEVIKEKLESDVRNGTSKTGMRPFMQSDSLKFLQVWSVFLSTKI